MKTKKRETGDLGEGVVCKYLENKGFKILERNYTRKWGEIDVVTQKGHTMHFVEVKTVTREPSALPVENDGSRETGRGIRPEENMHPGKIQRLHRAIQTYLIDHKVPDDTEWQLDLACVYLNMNTRKARVEMIENVIL